MSETQASYRTGYPGDETTPRLGYTADEVAPGEYAPRATAVVPLIPRGGLQPDALMPGETADHAMKRRRRQHAAEHSATDRKPTYDDLALAIHEYVESYEGFPNWRDNAGWTPEQNIAATDRRLNAITALHDLARRFAPRRTEEAN